MTMRISVAREDVLMFPCDILLLKYAEVNRGADLAVADALGKAALSVKKGKHEFFRSGDRIRASELLVLGVGPLASVIRIPSNRGLRQKSSGDSFS